MIKEYTSEDRIVYGQMPASSTKKELHKEFIKQYPNFYKHERATIQRYISLENAFGTVDAFAIPSANPDILEKYEEVKKYLLEMYQGNITESDINNYKF